MPAKMGVAGAEKTPASGSARVPPATRLIVAFRATVRRPGSRQWVAAFECPARSTRFLNQRAPAQTQARVQASQLIRPPRRPREHLEFPK